MSHSLVRYVLLILTVALSGCGNQSAFRDIDRRVDELIAQRSEQLGPDAHQPGTTIDRRIDAHPNARGDRGLYREQPSTLNPAASDLRYERREEAESVAERMARSMEEQHDAQNAIELDLAAALTYAVHRSREHRFAQEEYVLAALRLLIERHLWGPRFFNTVSTTVAGSGDDGFFDTAMNIVNEFRVTQRLPYGGEVSARALARASADLHGHVSSSTPAGELILSGSIPLLRGAGDAAREDRIQAERNMVYAARQYEQFRRQFLFDVSRDFLNLVVQSQGIDNARRQVESLEWLERRTEAFVETGRETPIDLALAQRSTLFARDSLNRQIESFRLSTERFKVRIGLPSEQAIVIMKSDPGLPVPEVSLDAAVEAALTYRLDLQTLRDRVDDAKRNVAVAQNRLLPDLDLFGATGMATEASRRRPRPDFRPEDGFFEVGVTFGLPLDREIERVNMRQAQISLERILREYDRFRDTLAVETRSAVRDIDRVLFSLQIQERNVTIAERALAGIRADPDRATPRDRTEAVDALLRAQGDLDAAHRDLQLAIMRYLLESGQLRVSPDGRIQPLQGMDLAGG